MLLWLGQLVSSVGGGVSGMALIPDQLQGRVNSAVRLLAFGFQPIGAAACGVMLQAFGADTTVLVFSAVTLGLAGLATLNTHVRNAPRPAVARTA